MHFQMMIKKILSRVTELLLAFCVTIYIILEELIWDILAKPVYDYIHSLRILQKLETSIETLNRYTLLVIFLALFIQVELVGIVSLKLITQGNISAGIALYIGKIPIAVFTFWLFRISKDKLISFIWFKYSYDLLMMINEKIKASPIHQKILARIKVTKEWLKKQVPKQFIARLSALLAGLKKSLNM